MKRTDPQYLEDKIARKFSFRNLKNINMAGKRVLVGAVLTSQALYHITSIDLPKEIIQRIIALLRAYIWVVCYKETNDKVGSQLG
jgi:hypothetical protein